MTKRITESSRRVADSADQIISGGKTDQIGIFIKLDREVLEWFRGAGPGYQRRVNEVLKRFVRAVNDGEAGERMSVVEKAQALFEEYYERCFWHMKPDLIITEANLPQIISGLRTYGGRSGFLEASSLCR